VLFFRAAERYRRDADPLLVWRRVAPGIEVEEIPGSHYTLIREPAAERVAAALLRRLAPETEVGERLRQAA
jgi:thioesterase domain-containing protein